MCRLVGARRRFSPPPADGAPEQIAEIDRRLVAAETKSSSSKRPLRIRKPLNRRSGTTLGKTPLGTRPDALRSPVRKAAPDGATSAGLQPGRRAGRRRLFPQVHGLHHSTSKVSQLCSPRLALTPGLGAGFYVGNGFLRPRGPECFGENTLASHVTAAYLKREHRL